MGESNALVRISACANGRTGIGPGRRRASCFDSVINPERLREHSPLTPFAMRQGALSFLSTGSGWNMPLIPHDFRKSDRRGRVGALDNPVCGGAGALPDGDGIGAWNLDCWRSPFEPAQAGSLLTGGSICGGCGAGKTGDRQSGGVGVGSADGATRGTGSGPSRSPARTTEGQEILAEAHWLNGDRGSTVHAVERAL